MLTNEQNILFIFPGQGSQYKGMGGDLYKAYETARNIYTQASETLGCPSNRAAMDRENSSGYFLIACCWLNGGWQSTVPVIMSASSD